MPRSRKRTVSGYTTKLKPPKKRNREKSRLPRIILYIFLLAGIAAIIWQREYLSNQFEAFFAEKKEIVEPNAAKPSVKSNSAKKITEKEKVPEITEKTDIPSRDSIAAVRSEVDLKKNTEVKVDTAKKQEAIPAPIQKNIQVEVLNGCGVRGIAAKFTKYLRKQGIDVVKTGNYKSSKVKKSQVIDRIGNKDFAKEVGSILGIKPKYIYTKKNKKLLIDATVIIGKDYKQLKQ